VVAVWGARSECGWAELFPIVERRVASEVCPLFFQLGGGDAMRYALTAAGFTGVEVERIATTLAYDSGESACGAAFAGGRSRFRIHGLTSPRGRRCMGSIWSRLRSTERVRGTGCRGRSSSRGR